MRLILRTIVVCLCFPIIAYAIPSPYDFGIPPQKDLTHDDLLRIQEILQSKQAQLEILVKSLYPTDRRGYATQNDYIGRCLRGVHQILIDPKKGWYPEVKLEKIGNGGDRCIVTCVPYLNKYPELAREKTEHLRKTGFNGYYFYMVGGYPNPTGREIQYVGVPYAMKIFAMLEAQKRGFQKVIWVDSAMMPLKDPSPLFEWLENNGAYIQGWRAPIAFCKYVLPDTRRLLKELTGTDVLKTYYINTTVFGLKMDTELARSFIDEYFNMLDLGTPFLSCFPEECVFMAIYGQPKYRKWKKKKLCHLIKYAEAGVDDTPESIEIAKKQGKVFYQLRH